MSTVSRNAELGLAAVRDGAEGDYGPLAKASGCVDGLANRLALALTTRNIDPDGARAQLVAALAAWPIVCRVMAELERSAPDLVAEAASRSDQVVAQLDRRDAAGGSR